MPRIAIVSPCYDDFNCISKLIGELLQIKAEQPGFEFRLLIVNDSPWINPNDAVGAASMEGTGSELNVSVVNLSANLGHQRAIAIGLARLSKMCSDFDYVVTIDIDGEDDTFLIPRMVQCLEAGGRTALACVAARRSRSESLGFRAGYLLYKQITRVLAGVSIDYGNFICFSAQSVRTLVRVPDTSIHLAAALIKSRMPFSRILGDRRSRYSGVSKMGGYSALVLHAFRAYSVLGETIAVRLILLTIIALIAIVIGIGFSGFIRLTGIFLVFPGWASIVAVNLISLGVIASFTLFALALNLITAHASSSITPLALADRYVESEITLL